MLSFYLGQNANNISLHHGIPEIWPPPFRFRDQKSQNNINISLHRITTICKSNLIYPRIALTRDERIWSRQDRILEEENLEILKFLYQVMHLWSTAKNDRHVADTIENSIRTENAA